MRPRIRFLIAWAFVAALAAPSATPSPTRKTNSPTWISHSLPDAEELRKACPESAPGTPIVEAHLLAEGTVGEVKVVKSGGCKAADRLVSNAVKTWTFKPILEDGKPVSFWLTLSVSISMH
jgi:TonB family protein